MLPIAVSALRSSLLATTLVLAASAPPPISGAVHLVDNTGPGQPYSTIQEAIDIARDGDVVLIRAGTYDSFTVTDGRSPVAP